MTDINSDISQLKSTRDWDVWQKKLQSSCAFCDGKSDSKEHFPPKWVQKWFGDIRAGYGHAVSFGNSAPETGFLHQKGVKAKTIRCVCQVCNNGWMGDIQEKAKDLVKSFSDDDLILTKEDREALLRWAVLSTMIYEFADYRTMATTSKERRNFKLTGKVSNNWRVLVGRTIGPMVEMFNHVSWLETIKMYPEAPPCAYYAGQTTMFVLGNMVMITVSRELGRGFVGDRGFLNTALYDLKRTAVDALPINKHINNFVELEMWFQRSIPSYVKEQLGRIRYSWECSNDSRHGARRALQR